MQSNKQFSSFQLPTVVTVLQWLIVLTALFAVIVITVKTVSADMLSLTPPPKVECPSQNYLLYENKINFDILDAQGRPEIDLLLERDGFSAMPLPFTLPADFVNGPVEVTIDQVVAWDGYNDRPFAEDEDNERFSLVFVKNGVVVWSSAWTGTTGNDGIDDGMISDSWVGGLGTALLPNGADTVYVVHWSDDTYGNADFSSNNSVVPAGICVTYKLDGVGGAGSIGDRIWWDVNGNGVQDLGEPDLAGVEVELTFPDGTTITTVTDANGYYRFDNLAPGTYTVTVNPATLPAGAQQTFDRDGTLDNTTTVTLGANENINYVDFGYIGRMCVGDYVWIDANGNGLQDESNTGIANVLMQLWQDTDNDGVFSDGDTFISEQSTDADGDYLFCNLFEGKYIVTVAGVNFTLTGPLAGFQPTAAGSNPTDSNTADDSDGTVMGGFIASGTVMLNLGAEPGGDTNSTVDFGFVPAQATAIVLNGMSAGPSFLVPAAIALMFLGLIVTTGKVLKEEGIF